MLLPLALGPICALCLCLHLLGASQSGCMCHFLCKPTPVQHTTCKRPRTDEPPPFSQMKICKCSVSKGEPQGERRYGRVPRRYGNAAKSSSGRFKKIKYIYIYPPPPAVELEVLQWRGCPCLFWNLIGFDICNVQQCTACDILKQYAER